MYLISLKFLISLDAAGSDLPSLPAPFFPPSTDGGGSGRVCRVLKLFPLFLKYGSLQNFPQLHEGSQTLHKGSQTLHKGS